MFTSSTFALAVLPWLPVSPPAALPTAAVVAGDATQWPLAPGEVRRHVVTLEAGQFVRVTVKQAGIDVTVHLYAPDGAAGDLVDANEGPRGWEPASLLASTSGTHVIEVAAAPTAPEAGHYVVDADPPHAVEPRDRRRLIAETARARAAVGLGPRAVYAKRSLSARASMEAVRQLPLAAGIFHALGETCWEADSLTFLGLLQGWAYVGVDYLDIHARALALWEKCGDRYRHAEAHNYAAEGYMRANQYSRAVETYERGLALAREEGARDIELLLLNNAGGIYNLLGETDKGLRYGEEALAEFRARGLGLLEEIALQNLARAHLRRGELDEAAERAHESLACARRISDSIGESLVAGTLGEIYLTLGEPAEARRILIDGLPTGFRDPLTGGPYQPYFDLLVRTYEDAGDAWLVEALERALAHQQLVGHRQGELAGLLALARIHLRHGDPERAREAAYQASEQLRSSGDRFDLAAALELLGGAAIGMADVENARRAFQESLEIRRGIGDGQGEAMSLHGLARVDRVRGDPQAACARME
jgi:tetratricopeptide (TPR) repeat protein